MKKYTVLHNKVWLASDKWCNRRHWRTLRWKQGLVGTNLKKVRYIEYIGKPERNDCGYGRRYYQV